MATIEERLKNVVVEQLDVEEDKIKRDASFIGDLGADSLDVVELVMAMEEEFDIEVPDEDAEKIKSFGNAVEYIESKLN